MAVDADWLAHVPQGPAFLAAAGLAAAVLAVLRVLAARTPAGLAAIRLLHAAEAAIVALLLASMLLLSFTQVVLRNAAHTGWLWVDPLLRHLLLWVGFLGATLATRLDRHINVDALTRLLRGPWLRLARVATSLGAGTVCVILCGACMAALRDEAQAHTVGFLGVPVWCLQTVMPVALFVMAVRFGRHTLESVFGVPGTEVPLPPVPGDMETVP